VFKRREIFLPKIISYKFENEIIDAIILAKISGKNYADLPTLPVG
jgi:hypothetical protein